MIWILVAAAVVIVLFAVILVVLRRRRRRPDGVAQFQRHIGALSPEARRPVVDKVQQLDDTGGRRRRQGRDA